MADVHKACSHCGNIIAASLPCPYCARKRTQAIHPPIPVGRALDKAARHGFVLTLDVSIEAAHELCTMAILKDNYLIEVDRPDLIRCKENRPFTAISLTTAVTLDVLLQVYGPKTTMVVIDVGHGFGGLFDSVVATNRSHMGRLKSMIQTCYREHLQSAPENPMDISGQISKLAELYTNGHLTLEEFTQAKARLLGS